MTEYEFRRAYRRHAARVLCHEKQFERGHPFANIDMRELDDTAFRYIGYWRQ